MKVTKVLWSFILGIAATITAAQDPPFDSKPGLPIQSQNTIKKNNETIVAPKIKLDLSEIKKLVIDLDNNSYRLRQQASSKLLEMSKALSFEELNNFLVYILKEDSNTQSLEVQNRLKRIQDNIFSALRQTVANQAQSPKRTEVPLKLMKVLDENRSAHIWRKLAPEVIDIITQGVSVGETIYDEHANTTTVIMKTDPELMEQLSKLLVSPFNKDPKDLQDISTELIVSLAKPPLNEYGAFILLYNAKLKALTTLPEDKLSEIEKGLKELKGLHLQGDQLNYLEVKLAQSAKPYLEEILKININAFSTNDPKKQKIAMDNIDALKEQFNTQEVKNLISTENGALVLQRRQEFSKNIMTLEELQLAIATAQFISILAKDDINFHKTYISWLEKQVDSSKSQKPSDKGKIQDILEHTLQMELKTIAQKGVYNNPLRQQEEIINSLIKTYTKLVQQSNLNSEFLFKNLEAFMDFQCFSFSYSDYSTQKKSHPDLLTLFDSVIGNINKLNNTHDKLSLRKQVIACVPYVDINAPCQTDYVNRLSRFYSEEKDPNRDEFVSLVDSLLNSPDSGYVGKCLPPDMMLQFIENNLPYFEKNIQHIIETCTKSKDQKVKSEASGQLQRVNSSFYCLFEKNRIVREKIGYEYLTQFYPATQIANLAEFRNRDLVNKPDWIDRISKIEEWFKQKLEKK